MPSFEKSTSGAVRRPRRTSASAPPHRATTSSTHAVGGVLPPAGLDESKRIVGRHFRGDDGRVDSGVEQPFLRERGDERGKLPPPRPGDRRPVRQRGGSEPRPDLQIDAEVRERPGEEGARDPFERRLDVGVVAGEAEFTAQSVGVGRHARCDGRGGAPVRGVCMRACGERALVPAQLVGIVVGLGVRLIAVHAFQRPGAKPLDFEQARPRLVENRDGPGEAIRRRLREHRVAPERRADRRVRRDLVGMRRQEPGRTLARLAPALDGRDEHLQPGVEERGVDASRDLERKCLGQTDEADSLPIAELNALEPFEARPEREAAPLQFVVERVVCQQRAAAGANRSQISRGWFCCLPGGDHAAGVRGPWRAGVAVGLRVHGQAPRRRIEDSLHPHRMSSGRNSALRNSTCSRVGRACPRSAAASSAIAT